MSMSMSIIYIYIMILYEIFYSCISMIRTSDIKYQLVNK